MTFQAIQRKLIVVICGWTSGKLEFFLACKIYVEFSIKKKKNFYFFVAVERSFAISINPLIAVSAGIFSNIPLGSTTKLRITPLPAAYRMPTGPIKYQANFLIEFSDLKFEPTI